MSAPLQPQLIAEVHSELAKLLLRVEDNVWVKTSMALAEYTGIFQPIGRTVSGDLVWRMDRNGQWQDAENVCIMSQIADLDFESAITVTEIACIVKDMALAAIDELEISDSEDLAGAAAAGSTAAVPVEPAKFANMFKDLVGRAQELLEETGL